MKHEDNEDSPQFVDPALKSVVSRAWASEKAPPALRARIERMMQANTSQPKSKPKLQKTPTSLRQRLMWPLAASIAIVLFLQIKSLLPPPTPPPPPKLAALPAQFYTDVIARHQQCSQSVNHHQLDIGQPNDAAIAKVMLTQLSQSVLMARPSDWVFRGASLCTVGDVKSGHLLFAKGAETLSIFSLPQSMVPGLTDGCEFQTTSAGFAIVSFTRNGGLFSLVESDLTGTANIVQLVKMRTTLEASVTPGPGCACIHPQPVGELTYAVNTSTAAAPRP